MRPLKEHADTISILSTILVTVVGAVLWINAQFNEMNGRFTSVDARFASIEKDIAIIKTVMIMNHHMPCELAHQDQEK